MKRWGVLILVFLGLVWVSCSSAQEGIHIEAGEITYDEVNQVIEARGGVKLTWQDLALSTYRLLYFFSDHTLLVPEPLEVVLGKNRAKAKRFFFDFQKNAGWIEDAELFYVVDAQRKLYFRGSKIRYQEGKWWGKDLLLTGSQKEPPAYSFRADEITVYPNERIEMRGVGFFINEHRLLYLPALSKDLRRKGSSFLPQIGHQREKGFFIGGNYELFFAEKWRLLFEAEYASRAGFLGSGNLFWENGPWTGSLFYDFRQQDEDSFGGYVFYEGNRFRGGVISYFNQPLDDARDGFLSRPLQMVARFNGEEERTSWGLDLSYGFFEEKPVSDSRFDVRGTLEWNNENVGVSLLAHYTSFGFYPDRFLWGGKVHFLEEVNPDFSYGATYTFLSDNVASPFSFDTEREHSLSLEFALGKEEESRLRIRGTYDFSQGCFDEAIFGLTLGSEDFAVGFEEQYSFVNNEALERRYFIRKKISDAILVEASYLSEEQTFYLDATLIGFDAPPKDRSLFVEEEPFDLFEVGRDTR
jgi:hypothetical protein